VACVGGPVAAALGEQRSWVRAQALRVWLGGAVVTVRAAMSGGGNAAGRVRPNERGGKGSDCAVLGFEAETASVHSAANATFSQMIETPGNGFVFVQILMYELGRLAWQFTGVSLQSPHRGLALRIRTISASSSATV
jgi:hypothetical protein